MTHARVPVLLETICATTPDCVLFYAATHTLLTLAELSAVPRVHTPHGAFCALVTLYEHDGARLWATADVVLLLQRGRLEVARLGVFFDAPTQCARGGGTLRLGGPLVSREQRRAG